MKFYKKKYAICIYEKGGAETLIAMFDNAKDFAKHLHISIEKAYDKLGKHFNNKTSTDFIYNRKMTTLEFVDMMED